MASEADPLVDAVVVGAMTDKRLTDMELELLVVGIRWGEKPRWEKVLNALEELQERRAHEAEAPAYGYVEIHPASGWVTPRRVDVKTLQLADSSDNAKDGEE